MSVYNLHAHMWCNQPNKISQPKQKKNYRDMETTGTKRKRERKKESKSKTKIEEEKKIFPIALHRRRDV